MPLMIDCDAAETGHGSKDDECHSSPPEYVGLDYSGYCGKSVLVVSHSSTISEQSASISFEPGSSDSSHYHPKNQPCSEFIDGDGQYERPHHSRLESTRSSLSSGFGSSAEKENETDSKDDRLCSADANTETSNYVFNPVSSTEGSMFLSSENSSTTYLKRPVGLSSSTGYSDKPETVLPSNLQAPESVATESTDTHFSNLSAPESLEIPRNSTNSSTNSATSSGSRARTSCDEETRVQSQNVQVAQQIYFEDTGISNRVSEDGQTCPEMVPLLSVSQQGHGAAERSDHATTCLDGPDETFDINPNVPEAFVSTFDGMGEVLLIMYREDKPIKISCEVPKLRMQSASGGTSYTAFDPEKILDIATDHCGILYPYKPMFGLWKSSSKEWVVMSQHVKSVEKLELRVKYTVPVDLNPGMRRGSEGEQQSDQDNNCADDETVSAFPSMNVEVLRYLFHQRRHEFLKTFRDPEAVGKENRFIRYLLPQNGDDAENDDYDPVLYLAVFDELRKRVESGGKRIVRRGCLAKILEDILPKAMCADLRSYSWYNLNKRVERQIIWERFRHLLEKAAGRLCDVKKEILYIAYVNHVEKLQSSLSCEIFMLDENLGSLSINGDRGITLATEDLKSIGKVDFDEKSKCEDGFQMKIIDDVTILELNFHDVADMQTSPGNEKKLSLTDILGNNLELLFTTKEDTVRFIESINRYYKLTVDHTRDFPSLRNMKLNEKVFVHESIRERYLVNVLTKHPNDVGCVYRRRTSHEHKMDVFIKSKQDGDTTVRRSSIEKMTEGRLRFCECEDLEIQANSMEDFVEKIVTHKNPQKIARALGNSNYKALVNVITPPAIEPCALLKTRSYQCKRELKEMGQLNDDQFGAVVDVFAGDFTMSMVTKFSSNKYTLLIRIMEMRERQQSFANELEEAMNVIFPVRHHRHIAKQIGTGVAFNWKVLEYSKWGNLSTYFEKRAIRGAETHGDVMVMTGHWLIQIFYQLALALNYMATKNLAHGGIRADNVLIIETSPTPFVKLGHPGVRYCELSNEMFQGIKGKVPCKQKSWIPTLPRPWLAKEVGGFLDSAACKPTLEGDIWAFGACIAEIITYAKTGKSFQHIWSYLETWRPVTKAFKHLEKVYSGHSDHCKDPGATKQEVKNYCDVASLPTWLAYPDQSPQTNEKFRDKVKRCWSKVPMLRPTIHELLQSISILVHNNVGQTVEIYPENRDTSSNDRMKFQEEIPSFSDRDLSFEKELSAGKFGRVTLYQQISTKRLFAVKDTKMYDHRSMKSFTYELRTMLRLDHENIVRTEGMTVPSQRIVMEFINGGSLESRFHMQHYFDSGELIVIALDIAKGLQELHRMNILHRDLAARNILLKFKENSERRVVAVISDFGLSRAIDTAYYTAVTNNVFPERWCPPGDECLRFSKMTDIWSYGVTVWEMYARRKPDKIAPLDKPYCCPEMVYLQIISRCWKVDPNHRIKLDQIINVLNGIRWGSAL